MKHYFAVLFFLNNKPYTFELFETERTLQELKIFAEEYINLAGYDDEYVIFIRENAGTYQRYE